MLCLCLVNPRFGTSAAGEGQPQASTDEAYGGVDGRRGVDDVLVFRGSGGQGVVGKGLLCSQF